MLDVASVLVLLAGLVVLVAIPARESERHLEGAR
jgi:hypothetical protein